MHPDHGRRGLGTELVIGVCQWAAASGHSWVTLTTFRDVRWNMPFYARLGFEEIPPEEISPALKSVIEDETRRGLDPNRRVAMRRRCMLPTSADLVMCSLGHCWRTRDDCTRYCTCGAICRRVRVALEGFKLLRRALDQACARFPR